MCTCVPWALNRRLSGTGPKFSPMREVLVFRTTVDSGAEVSSLQEALDCLVAGGRWNFDLDDRERILRVDSAACRPAQVIAALAKEGYACEELED